MDESCGVFACASGCQTVHVDVAQVRPERVNEKSEEVPAPVFIHVVPELSQ